MKARVLRTTCDICKRDKMCSRVSFRVPGMATRFKKPGWACKDCQRDYKGSWRYAYD